MNVHLHLMEHKHRRLVSVSLSHRSFYRMTFLFYFLRYERNTEEKKIATVKDRHFQGLIHE